MHEDVLRTVVNTVPEGGGGGGGVVTMRGPEKFVPLMVRDMSGV